MTVPLHATTSGLARDLVFLAVAGDDALGSLGVGYATVRMTADDVPATGVPDGALVLHWSVPEPATWGRHRQRVCLSVAGHRPPAVVAAVLERAGAVVCGLAAPHEPIVAVTPSSPLVQLGVAGRAVISGYDVVTRAG